METRHSQEEAGTHIWLRYATQYTRDGRTHTIEMSIPVPVGASAEQRERLIQEAEAGMRQLVSHVDGRVSAPSQRSQGAAPAAKPVPPHNVANRPAAEPAPQTAPQPISRQPAPARTREVAPESAPPAPPEVAVPPSRPSVGASMPSMLTLTGNGNGQRTQIIRFIREVLGMTPAEVMKVLNIKTLFNDIDQGELVDRLNQLATRKSAGGASPANATSAEATTAERKTREDNETHDARQDPKPPERPAVAETSSAPAPNRPIPFSSRSAPVPIIIEPEARQKRVPIEEPEMGEEDEEDERISVVREVRPVIFDEEVDADEEELEDLDVPPEFTPHELTHARDILENLRTKRGANAASPARLQVLSNVLGDQISKAQLQELTSGIWNVTQLRRLKVEQLEALVSWGKEDNFVNEVEAVLTVLEEERYARGDR